MNALSSTTALITGATGLVGARLLPRLAELGVNCRALIRGGRGAPADVGVAAGDLLDPASLAAAVEGVTAIVHLAAAKAHAPEARFIMASTSLVYDADNPWPGREGDPADPRLDYPASKLAAEDALRHSGLNWVIQRLGFVYGDGDGHLEALPKLAANAGFHPAQRMSLLHHCDIATAMKLALTGAMDREVVNIADEAPTSIFELTELAGAAMAPSAGPLKNPWHLQMDGATARLLGFRPTVRTIHQAVQEALL